MYSVLQQQLKDAVVNSLSNELYSNAAFLCERLLAEIDNEDVRLMLAECYASKFNTFTFLFLNISSRGSHWVDYNTFEQLRTCFI